MVLLPQAMADDDSVAHLLTVVSQRRLELLKQVWPTRLQDWARRAGDRGPAWEVANSLHNVLRKMSDYSQPMPPPTIAFLAVAAAAWPFLAFEGYSVLRDIRLALMTMIAPHPTPKDSATLQRAYALLLGSEELSIKDFGTGDGDWSGVKALTLGVVAPAEDVDDDELDLRYTVSGRFRVMRRDGGDTYSRHRLVSVMTYQAAVEAKFPVDAKLVGRLVEHTDPADQVARELTRNTIEIPLG